jgi:hypothetical protein
MERKRSTHDPPLDTGGGLEPCAGATEPPPESKPPEALSWLSAERKELGADSDEAGAALFDSFVPLPPAFVALARNIDAANATRAATETAILAPASLDRAAAILDVPPRTGGPARRALAPLDGPVGEEGVEAVTKDGCPA